MNGIQYLESGYAKPRFEGSRPYREMSLIEVKNLRYGEHIEVRGTSGKVVTVKINGSPQTWKTRPNDVKVPVKYGMRECGYIVMIEGEFDYDGPVPVFYVNNH
jgi:hypothetical protein